MGHMQTVQSLMLLGHLINVLPQRKTLLAKTTPKYKQWTFRKRIRIESSNQQSPLALNGYFDKP